MSGSTLQCIILFKFTKTNKLYGKKTVISNKRNHRRFVTSHLGEEAQTLYQNFAN